MARIARTQKSDTFSALRNDPYRLSLREDNDCSVLAVAVVCGVSYRAAHDALAARGRRVGRGVFNADIIDACRSFGFVVTRWTGRQTVDLLESYPRSSRPGGRHGFTTHHPARFGRQWLGVGPTLMFVRGHVAAYRDGRVHDWSDDKAKRVLELWSVVPA